MAMFTSAKQPHQFLVCGQNQLENPLTLLEHLKMMVMHNEEGRLVTTT